MGLFSFLSKNKQETTDSGSYSADEQATARARAKRASNAGAPAGRGKDAQDPVLPEKKRARRRLVGAIALALGVAIGLPMILDSEPKPLASDIAIQIPSKDKPAASHAASTSSRVAASAALDKTEEIVTMPAKPAEPAAGQSAKIEAAPKAEAKPVAEPKHEAKLAENKPAAEPRHETRPAESKPAAREVKAVDTRAADAKAEARPHDAKPREPKAGESKPAEAARALAILEGKPGAPQEASSGKYVVQVAALATQDKIDELQGKLKDAGIKYYAQKVPTQAGDRTRIRVGPFVNREEAEKMRAKLVKAGLSGTVVPA